VVIWCENATLLTDTVWSYIKVPQKGSATCNLPTLADVALAFGTS
jgi:hypothetical protein